MKKRALIFSCVLLLVLFALVLTACNPGGVNNTKKDYSSDPIVGTYIGTCNTDNVRNGFSYYVIVSFDKELGYFTWKMTVAKPPMNGDPAMFSNRDLTVSIYNAEKESYSMSGDFSFEGSLAIEYRPIYEIKVTDGKLFVSGIEKTGLDPDGSKVNYMFEKTGFTVEQFRDRFKEQFS